MSRQQFKPQTRLSDEHREQLADLHREIDTIKNNHLFHMQESISKVEEDIKETKVEIKDRFDKLDERMWIIMGLVVTTLATIVLAAVFGA